MTDDTKAREAAARAWAENGPSIASFDSMAPFMQERTIARMGHAVDAYRAALPAQLPHFVTASDGAIYPCSCPVVGDHPVLTITPEEWAAQHAPLPAREPVTEDALARLIDPEAWANGNLSWQARQSIRAKSMEGARAILSQFDVTKKEQSNGQ